MSSYSGSKKEHELYKSLDNLYKSNKILKLKDVREDTITMEWLTLKIICHSVLAEPSGLIKMDIWMDSFKVENHTGGFVGLALRECVKVNIDG
jgi:hypothetical protein